MKFEMELYANPYYKIIEVECEKIAREYKSACRVEVGWTCKTAKDFNPAKSYEVLVLGYQNSISSCGIVLNIAIQNKLVV